jgi:DNA invertase Pin-like site-specific DNA recombinase
LHNATLVIAKLDRLSAMRTSCWAAEGQKASVRFVAADMLEANELVVGIMAVVAQAERKMISARVPARWWLECEGGVISGLFSKP